jgi:hypothetical protein
MMPQIILGSSWQVFIEFTIFCMCGCSAMIGISLAREWRPARHVLPFVLLLAVIDRVLVSTSFGGDLMSAGGAVIDSYSIMMSALLAYHYALSRQLVRQYPWMYRRFLVFGWRRLRTGPRGQSAA